MFVGSYLIFFISYLQASWVTEEEFGMGYLEIKPAPVLPSKPSTSNFVSIQNGSGLNVSQGESGRGRTVATGTLPLDSGNSAKDQILRTKPADGRLERTESALLKSDPGLVKVKGDSLVNGSYTQSSMHSSSVQPGTSRSVDNPKQMDESANRTLEENTTKVAAKTSAEHEVRYHLNWLR